MSEPFIGEIRLFANNYAPRGWMPCNGQILQINQNQALFALLGTTYGGNGVTTFALPDLRGRVPVHVSNTIQYGSQGGSETHTLTVNEMPAHTHISYGSQEGTASSPENQLWGKGALSASSTIDLYTQNPDSSSLKHLDASTINTTGGSQAHTNMQPYAVNNYCIAIQGIFPSRN